MRLASLVELASGFPGTSQALGASLGSYCIRGAPSCIMVATVLHVGAMCPTTGISGGVFEQDLISCISWSGARLGRVSSGVAI